MAQQMYDSYLEYGEEPTQTYDRMYVRSNVFLPGSEIDPRTGLLKPDRQPRARTQALRMEAAKLDREYARLDDAVRKEEAKAGMRMPRSVALVLMGLTAFVLCLILLVQQGELTETQKNLNGVMDDIEVLTKQNQQDEESIAKASDKLTICYAAVNDLGMVSPEDAQAIHLTAADTRPRLTAQAQLEQQQAQATAVPMTASAGD